MTVLTDVVAALKAANWTRWREGELIDPSKTWVVRTNYRHGEHRVLIRKHPGTLEDTVFVKPGGVPAALAWIGGYVDLPREG